MDKIDYKRSIIERDESLLKNIGDRIEVIK